MKNVSNTIIAFEKYAPDVPYWMSTYRHNGKSFQIVGLSRGEFLLDFPVAFMKQFKKHKIEHSMKLPTLEEAMRIAGLIYEGKAGEMESELPFSDYSDIIPIELYLELMPYFGTNTPKHLLLKLKKWRDDYKRSKQGL